MKKLRIPGITSIECPSCGREFGDYDEPVPWMGILHLTARCHVCHLEHLFEVDSGVGEASVVAVGSTTIA